MKDGPDVTGLFGIYCKVAATNSKISVVIADDSNGQQVRLKKFANNEPEIGKKWHRGNSTTFHCRVNGCKKVSPRQQERNARRKMRLIIWMRRQSLPIKSLQLVKNKKTKIQFFVSQ